MDTIFRRKIYQKLLAWKNERNGDTALLIEGARRVGKSTIVEEFAKNEYQSYILIDFSHVSKNVLALFDDTSDLDYLFLRLQDLYHVVLQKRQSLIVFDEVQFCPKARQAIKFLVKDHRYDYIETGSLISIQRNVTNILIPSEEERIQMNPMDYEEFRMAIGRNGNETLRPFFEKRLPLKEAHRNNLRDFRLYMLIGGMPQAVDTYLKTNNFAMVDHTKRDILALYEADLFKIDSTGQLSLLFENLPAQLSGNKHRYQVSSVLPSKRADRVVSLVSELVASKIVNVAYHVNDPNVGLKSSLDLSIYKMYCVDTGLFVALMFKDKEETPSSIYDKLLSDKLPANLGYLYENVIAQMFVANGKRLYYHTFTKEDSSKKYEIDFLLADGNKVSPIEVKSGAHLSHISFDYFCQKYAPRIAHKYLLTTKDYRKEGDVEFLPVYFAQFL